MPELERHRSLGTHVAAMFAERMAYLGHCAHPVVGHGVHDDRRAANAVALVADFLVVHTFQVAGGLVDVAFDGLGRHIRRLGLFDRETQPRVDTHVTTAGTGSDHDFANHPGPDLAALFVLAALAVLNIRPFAVSCHAKSLKKVVTLLC